MIKPDEPAGRSVVTPLRRLPVRQSTVVRASVEHTFGTFVTKMGAWWPVQLFSAGRDRVRDVTVEQRQGGRVYETWDDGTEIDWGMLIVWRCHPAPPSGRCRRHGLLVPSAREDAALENASRRCQPWRTGGLSWMSCVP